MSHYDTTTRQEGARRGCVETQRPYAHSRPALHAHERNQALQAAQTTSPSSREAPENPRNQAKRAANGRAAVMRGALLLDVCVQPRLLRR